MNIEILDPVVEVPAVEALEPRFQILDGEELDQVGGGYCVADY